MAKRKAPRRARPARKSLRTAPKRRSARRPGKNRRAARPPKARASKARASKARASNAPRPARPSRQAATPKARPPRAASPRLDRPRRRLEDNVPTPPSSLDMQRRGSAVRTGRAEMAEELTRHPGMTSALTGGDVDANWEDAYFTGDEAPGGDNPTPDQDIVEDIGKSLGVQYEDNEELRSSDKVVERDKHRWELDPASSEDYKERK